LVDSIYFIRHGAQIRFIFVLLHIADTILPAAITIVKNPAMLYHLIVSETIIFLGTGGARITVTKQILASGGIWLSLDGTEILLDPGPGSIVHSTKRKLNADNLSAIILSHRHIDHSSDVNIMAEAMTQGGFRKHGWLFAPADALDTEPVIFSYQRNNLEGVEVLKEGKSYHIGNVSFTTPVRHIHGVETYGMLFNTGKHTFSYVADTRYFDSLPQTYAAELMILNVVRLDADHPFDHLSVPDVKRIVTEARPKVAILTHLGMMLWRAKPWEIADRLAQETGIRVITARDGMKFELAQLDKENTAN
jgi:ribonuclease BN (tRNA processing enzyme)